jgi:alpha-1,2-mannosyltransferase
MISKRAPPQKKTKKPVTTNEQNINRSIPQPVIHVNTIDLPTLNQIFGVFAFVNFLSAILNPIADCDETYNYWEPTHQVMYGWGFQTWEYSPVFALRSYLYVGIHALFGIIARFFGAEKIQIFYAIRMTVGIICAFSETVFIKGVYERFGRKVAITTFLFIVFSSGMFNASTSYLPSAFVMCSLMISFGSWYSLSANISEKNFKYSLCIASVGVAGIIGWPFCIIAVIPLAIDTIYHHGFMPSLVDALKVFAILAFFTIYIDHFYYGKIFFTPLHLILYNRGSGSELYGTEPWHFYIRNLFLNFNFNFLFSLLTPILLLLNYWIVYRHKTQMMALFYRRLLYLSPYYLWLIFYSIVKHKEERFMYVVYPIICLSGALSIELLAQIVNTLIFESKLTSTNITSTATTTTTSTTSTITTTTTTTTTTNHQHNHHQHNHHQHNNTTTNFINKESIRRDRHFLIYFFQGLIIVIICLIGISRTVAIVVNYRAPLEVYGHLSQHLIRENVTKSNICVGKEWYRFPSNFFLPHQGTQLRFLRTSFRGLLPKPYANGPEATSMIPTTMNDENREEMDRYITLNKCDYIIDLELQEEPPYYSEQDEWQMIHRSPFLDAKHSPVLTRAFYIPIISEQKNTFGDYCLLKRVKPSIGDPNL